MNSPTTPISKTASTEQPRSDATKRASAVAEDVKSAARDAIDSAKSEAQARATESKDKVAEEVSGVSSALRTAADQLRSGSPQERVFAQLADGLADASKAIRMKDFGEMARDLSGYARENPTVFLGGSLLAGFAAARFARASEKPREDETQGAHSPNATVADGVSSTYSTRGELS